MELILDVLFSSFDFILNCPEFYNFGGPNGKNSLGKRKWMKWEKGGWMAGRREGGEGKDIH